MPKVTRTGLFLLLSLALVVTPRIGADQGTVDPIDQRFSADIEEVPSFQKHVVPLFGRLGCNGRACHGSFQGQGGFQLSLFGYDFNADHEALFAEDSPRVDRKDPLESLILIKPTDEEMHDGGKRYDLDGWQYRVFKNWIKAGAPFEKDNLQKLARLEVTPQEIQFNKKGQAVQLQAVAVWEDGTREDVTPLCRFRTNDDQIAIIDENGKVSANASGDTHVVVFYDNGVVPIAVIRPVSDKVGKAYPKVATPTKIDKHVVNKLRKLGIVPSDVADDTTFLRRVSLDLTGTLPSVEEIKQFINDKSPDKRAKKIDELLESPAYAAWWTTKLNDFTGNNAQQLNNIVDLQTLRYRPAKDWYDWIYKRVEENRPYDEIATGIILATSRDPEESYEEFCEEMSQIYRGEGDKEFADRHYMPYYWARRDFREREARAIGFAYSFMGVRIQCAQCHKHPFDQWSKDDFAKFQVFFDTVAQPRRSSGYNEMIKELGITKTRGNEIRQELEKKLKEGKTVPFREVTVTRPRASNNNRRRGRQQPTATIGRLLGGEDLDLTQFEDPRKPLMEWLGAKDNPFFARAFVNRVWANYFNVGIVEPPDDLNLANPPSNRELLEYLTQGFIDSEFDMKWLHREICNSRTYQLSWKTNETNINDKRNFSRAVPRRLPAEVAYDALAQATATRDEHAKARDELGGRAISIPTVGRYNNPGLSREDRAKVANANFALGVFGRSTRESNCDCDRSMEPSLLQTVFLQNDRNVLAMVGNRGWVNEVTDRANAPDQARRTSLNRQVASLQKQLNQAVRKRQQMRDSQNKGQLEKADKRIAQLRKRVAAIRAQLNPSSKVEAQSDDKTRALITEAYLRTLSRYPNQDEMKRTMSFIKDSPNVAEGLEGVLWALINTKEFIINH